MAIEKTVTINVDGKRAVKSLEELGGTFEDVYGEMQPLNTQIGELEDRLYEMSLRGEQGTKEFKDLTSQVGKMRKTIIDTDLAIDGMSQNMSQATTGAVMGVASGFELAQGSMAAFGVEGEQVEATLLKVQSAMAISQGLQGIREAIPSFKNLAAQVSMFGGNVLKSVKALGAFQKAMIATGIGAIIAGVGLLVANWDKLTKAIGGTSEAQEINNKVSNEAIKAAAEELSALDKLSKTINDETISRDDKNRAVKDLQAEYPDLLKNVNAEKLSTEELNQAIELNTKLVTLQAKAKAAATIRAEEFEKQLRIENELRTGQRINSAQIIKSNAAEGKTAFDLLDSKEALKTAQKDALQQGIEEIKQSRERVDILDEQEKAIKDEIAALKEQMGVEEESTQTTKTNTKAVKENANERRKRWQQEDADLQARIEARKQRFEELNKQAEENADAALEAEMQREQRASDAMFVRLEAEQKAKEEARQKELDDEKAMQEAKYSIANQSLSGINDLVNAFAGENEKAQERAFKISKAINIAQAVMDTYKSANAIFASTAANPITIANPAAPFIAAGAAVAAGLANVATIAKQKFQGGSTGGGGATGGTNAPNLGNAGSNPATFNVVGNTGNNQLAQTLGSTPMKAYVVSGDVSTAQALERNKIEQSSL